MPVPPPSAVPPARRPIRPGTVYLVGAGPGDPELLTLRALRVLARAEVVVYDRLVGPEVLEVVPGDAERVFVGKMRSRHAVPQGEINALLVARARRGLRVARLKGGDPMVFARAGEELQALAAAGVPFEVVPGITAATGCAAYAGIPLTHRDHAHAVTFVTGHTKDAAPPPGWAELAKPGRTLVVYMGRSGLAALCRGLIDGGLPATTPAALVENGTYEHQSVLVGSLATLPAQVPRDLPGAPSLLIVGEVVALQPELAWFAAGLAGAPEGD